MKSVLYITANPKKEEESNSLSVGCSLVKEYRSLHPGAPIIHIDVFKEQIPLIDAHFLSARQKIFTGVEQEKLLPEEQVIMRRMHRFTSRFISADVYIFAYPLWNFGLPPLLKAYVDTIKVARQTFRYTPDGPEGLLKNKTAVIIQSSGDVYSHGPLKEFEHGSRFLTSVLTFIGVERIEVIRMEGMDRNKDAAIATKNQALNRAVELARTI